MSVQIKTVPFPHITVIHSFQNAPFKGSTSIKNSKAGLAESCAVKYGEWSLWY